MMPLLDYNNLSKNSVRHCLRAEEGYRVSGMLRAARVAEQTKVTAAGIACQSKLDEAVTKLIMRNPRPEAARNIEALSRANAIYLAEIIFDDEWR